MVLAVLERNVNLSSLRDLLDKSEAYQLFRKLPVWQWILLGYAANWCYSYYRDYIPIPVYGGVTRVSRYLATFRLTRLGPQQLSKLKDQYPMIWLPRLEFWIVYVQPQFVEELFRAPEDRLSFTKGTSDLLKVPWTFGKRMEAIHDHTSVVQGNLTRNLGRLLPGVLDEVRCVLDETIKFEGGSEWAKIQVFPWSLNIVARASNRIFVGLPLCRDPDWIDFNVNGPNHVIITATILSLLPQWSLPVFGWMLSPHRSRMRKVTKMLGPTIQKRLEVDPSEWPDDFLAWMMSHIPVEERTSEEVIMRLNVINFGAVHTSSLNFTQALYWLMAKPKYIEPLRAEIAEATGRHGWTKEALHSMPILESFIKECMRFTPLAGHILLRKVVNEPWTFSNGITLPVGTYVAAHQYGTHHDPEIYPNSDEFDAYRFVDENLMEKEGEDETVATAPIKARSTIYTTSKTYLPFGHGKHACPGRFFAAMELKLLMAHMIHNYDMKWPDEEAREEGYRPPNMWFNFNNIPDPKAHIMFRRRQ